MGAQMKIDRSRKSPWSRARAVAALGAVLLMAGCGMDDVEVPDLDGPSTFGQALQLTVTPDVVTADGFSTAFVQAELRDETGRLVANRDIFFALADELGRFADIGTLYDLAGNQLGAPEAIIRTNGQGVAQLIYRTPPRTDATANQSILISARPVGTNFNGAFYRTVRLELRSAEPIFFPAVPICDVPGAPAAPFCNRAPTCQFVVEAPDGFRAGRTILFQSSSFDRENGTIVRYEWFFGDGTSPDYFPQVAHVYRFPGNYVVTHVVTDDDGAQSACTTTVPIV
jgi:hypothetical protein